MRKSRYFMSVVLCVIAFAGFSSTNVDNAYCMEGPLYIGEYCWETESAFVRLGFTLMGDGHFTFCGIVDQPGIDEWPVNGNLEVVGDSAVMTVTGASVLDGGVTMISTVSHLILDISTLDGTANNMDMIWEDGVCSLDHELSILNSVSCDKSMSPDGVDKREELKRILRKFATTPEE